MSLLYVGVLGWHFVQVAIGVAPKGAIGLLRELTLYFFLPGPFLLLASLICRARVAIALSLVPLALFVLIYGPRFGPRNESVAAPNSFRVLTFNVGAEAGVTAPEAVLSIVQAAEPDVVAFQELPDATRRQIENALPDLPYRAATPDVATFSVYPLVEAAEFRLSRAAYSSQAVDILLDDRMVRLTNVHLLRTGPRISGQRTFAAFVRDYEPGLVENQVSELIEQHVRPVNGSQVLTGDFNQTEWSASHAMIRGVLQDSFGEIGGGFGHTFPSRIHFGRLELPLPLVRIDYVFHSEDLSAINARIGPNAGSDHLPMLVDLVFR